jgi:hypothetical protein
MSEDQVKENQPVENQPQEEALEEPKARSSSRRRKRYPSD